jgi:hypothetical protein
MMIAKMMPQVLLDHVGTLKDVWISMVRYLLEAVVATPHVRYVKIALAVEYSLLDGLGCR